MSGISILHSNGTRLAFLDTVGKVEIANSDRGTLLNVVHGGLFVSFLGSSNNNKVEILSSTFDENNCSMESSLVSQYSTEGGARINFNLNPSCMTISDTPGGGGLYIEFSSNVSDCMSSGVHGTRNTETKSSLTEVTYQLSSCKFIENQATSGDIKTTHIAHQCNNVPLPGRGGGMTVILMAMRVGTTSLFLDALFLGTLLNLVVDYVSFLGGSYNNKVEIISSTFDENNCSREPSLVSQYSTGGGAKINFECKVLTCFARPLIAQLSGNAH